MIIGVAKKQRGFLIFFKVESISIHHNHYDSKNV